MLEAVHLVKRFSGVTVVNDVSFELRPGEVVGYLGPNGSGKTTTTRMLTGLLEPTSGRILVDGRRIDEDLPAFHRRLGYVPEEPHLYQFLSGREYLELVGRLRELPPGLFGSKIGAMLELFGLQAAADQSIRSYSKGMRQRLLIIAALLHDPDVLIFDEPDSGLDPVRTSLLCDLILDVHKEHGGTYLLVTHNIPTAEKVSDYIGLLWQGRLAHYGPTAEAFASSDPFVRQFLAGDSAGPLGMD